MPVVATQLVFYSLFVRVTTLDIPLFVSFTAHWA